MKNFKLFAGVLLTGIIVVSCYRNTYADKTDNIELSDFTKGFISLYLSDSLIPEWMNASFDEITIACDYQDSLLFLSIWANDSNQYKNDYYDSYVRQGKSYLGKTSYSNYSIRVFGKENRLFFTVSANAPKQGRCVTRYYEYDPCIWTLCFDKDTSLRLDKTVLFSNNRDLTEVKDLIRKHFTGI